MEDKVGVLADLRQARAALSQNATYPADVALARNAIDRALSAAEPVIAERDALLKARAAIAELIAADREYDAARRAWDDGCFTRWDGIDNSARTKIADRFESATYRRASALAAMEG